MDETKEYFAEASERWSSRYAGKPRSIWDLDLILRRENIHRILRDLIAERGEKKLTVFDVGCGTADVLDGISRDAIEVEGFDMVQEMIDVASRRHPEDTYFVADINDLPLKEQHRDVIVCAGVLEYVDDPGKVLKAFYRELKPGGSLVVSFPNNKCVLRHTTRLLITIEEFLATAIRRLQGRKRRTEIPKYKHTPWNPTTVLALLKGAEFEVERIYFNTFGVGGRLGFLAPVKALSRWATHRLYKSRFWGEYFGMTTVFHAKKPQ